MAGLTRESIIAIAGELSDSTIMEMLKLEATEAELLEAFEWLSENDAMHREAKRQLHGRVAELYDLLLAEDQEDEENHPRAS
jgi:hypothetical protein